MRPIAVSLAAISAMLAPALSTAPAMAVANKTWVSATGSDANPCTIAQPCATFQHAHDQAAAGGEVGVLTAGEYGKVNIGKSIAIINDGSGEARIYNPLVGNPAVDINVGLGDVVTLRGLVIDGGGAGETGIFFSEGGAVHIQNCVIKNFQAGGGNVPGFSGVAIMMENTAGNSQLFVSDTLIYNNGTVSHTGGIRIWPFGAHARVVLDRVRLENNVIGLDVDGSAPANDSSKGAHVILRNSVVSGNANNGISAFTTPGKGAAFVAVESTSSVSNAGSGILADGPGATVLLGRSNITRNGAGVSTVNGGQLISYGNNQNSNNPGGEGTPTSFYSLF